MKYTPLFPPHGLDQELSFYLTQEFNRIRDALNFLVEGQVMIQYAEPKKLQDGMVVFADGTKWNPGSGQGLYERRGGAWHKL